MSYKIPIIKIKNLHSTTVYIPYRALSKKQKQHFLEYYLSHIYINNNNHIT